MDQKVKIVLLLIVLITILSITNLNNSDAQNTSTTKILDKKENGNNQVSISLTSTKSNYSPGEKIMLSGNIRNSTKAIVNHTVIIEAFKEDKLVYNSSTITDSQGKFTDSSLSMPYEGIITVTARSIDEGESTNTKATITILVAKEQWGFILPILFIISSVAFLLFSFPKHQRIGLLGAIGCTAAGYFFLYIYSPLDSVGNAAIAAALLVPLATYAFDTLSKRRETSSLLESSVGDYRKTHLTKEVESLANIFEEISLHQSIFKAKHDILENKLSKSNYNTSIKAGTMANLPGLRINQYYYYIDYFNKFLEAKLKKTGDLTDSQKYQEFDKFFQDLKRSFSELNTLLYVNVLYDLGEIQNRFLSFPTVEFPFRSSEPLRKLLDAAQVHENERKDVRIYSPENAQKLTTQIGTEFYKQYKNLESIIENLLKFKI